MPHPRPDWWPDEPTDHRPKARPPAQPPKPETFDEMYGKGKLKKLAGLLKAKAVETPIIGGCRLTLTWRGAYAQLDCWSDRVHWLMLDARGEAKYDLLIEHVPKFLKAAGVEYMTAATNEHIEAKGEWSDGVWVL